MSNEISKAMEILLGPKKKAMDPMSIILKAGGIGVEDVIEKAAVKKETKTEQPKEQAFEYEKYMDKSKGIKREDMPQIHEDNLDDFLIHFASKVPVKKLTRKLCDIKPTQREINEKKVLKKIKKKSENWKERTYIVSLDGYLLDGHHDWAQGLEMDPNYLVSIYRVGIPIDRLLDRTKRMKISEQRDLSDKEIAKGEETLVLSIQNGNSSLSKMVLRNQEAFTSQIVKAALQQQKV